LPEHTEDNDRLDPQIWKIVLVAILGSLLAQLDATVVNVSLASLAHDLRTTLPIIQWVTSGYLLALALMLPLNAWLVERVGTKRLYLACFSGFTLASVLCAFSWSATSLIGFRVLQGMTGGLMAPMAQLMLVRVAGKHFVRIIGYAARTDSAGACARTGVGRSDSPTCDLALAFPHQPANRYPGDTTRFSVSSL
jgi:MFS family permease